MHFQVQHKQKIINVLSISNIHGKNYGQSVLLQVRVQMDPVKNTIMYLCPLLQILHPVFS